MCIKASFDDATAPCGTTWTKSATSLSIKSLDRAMTESFLTLESLPFTILANCLLITHEQWPRKMLSRSAGDHKLGLSLPPVSLNELCMNHDRPLQGPSGYIMRPLPASESPASGACKSSTCLTHLLLRAPAPPLPSTWTSKNPSTNTPIPPPSSLWTRSSRSRTMPRSSRLPSRLSLHQQRRLSCRHNRALNGRSGSSVSILNTISSCESKLRRLQTNS